MKKVLSVIMSLAILISSFSVLAVGVESEREYTKYPVIVVPGYASSPMYRIDEETGETIHVWNIMIDEIVQALFSRIVDLAVGISQLTKGNAQHIAATVGKEFIRMYGDLACNDDGSSVYDVKRYHFDADETSSDYFINENPEHDFCRFEGEILGDYAQYIGQENIFNFACDFRMSAAECAAELDEYITDVKKFTGSEKVNIFAVSHGGQITGTYLSLYGEKGDVHNAVMTIPALGGSVLIYDLLMQNVDFDEEELVRFVEYGMMFEQDYNWLLKSNCLGFLDDVLNALVPYLYEVLGNWGSIWDFVPVQYYEELKSIYLDEASNAQIIARSDYMHYDIMANYAENFKKAQGAGTNISIIAGYSQQAISGSAETSDAIITANSSMGAHVAPYSSRFSDGYTQQVDTGFYQVSPAMDIDLSCAYLPFNTWAIEGLFHGMTYKDEYSAELLKTLLLTDEIKDVHTNPIFPQFHANTSPSSGVWAAFDKSREGFVCDDDSKLIIKNLSSKSKLKILAIRSNTGLVFDYEKCGEIAPGETAEIAFSGSLEKQSLVKKDLIIDYVLTNSITPIGERVMNFTLMNGEAVSFDCENPLSSINEVSILDSFISCKADKVLTKTGLKPFVSMIFNILASWAQLAFKYIINSAV